MADMTDAEYIGYELGKARTQPGDEYSEVKIKARSTRGESKWISITPEQFERLISAAATED